MKYLTNNFYKITTLIAIAILVVSQSQFYVKAQNSENVVQEKKELLAEQTDVPGDLLEEFNENGVNHASPHQSCFMEAYYNSPRSSTYNPPEEYGLAFVPTGNGLPGAAQSFFQDLNGDNLPDYVYTYNYTGAGTAIMNSIHFSCLYLHNGSGWDKAYLCYARTDTSVSTGEVVFAEYGADCAG